MTNIFIDIGYHLTIESNIPLLLCDSIEITLHVLRFRPTKLKTFCLQSSSPQLQLLVNPCPTLIHQNHIICKEHTPRDTTLYVSYNLIHHQSK
jgi:hypothetical protein